MDISDAYHHLRLHDSIIHYFKFSIDNEFFVAIGLPFGWAPAPGIFTKFLKEVVNILRRPHTISRGDWQIKNNYHLFGDYLVTTFLDDLLAVTTSTYCTNILCQAIM